VSVFNFSYSYELFAKEQFEAGGSDANVHSKELVVFYVVAFILA